MSRKLKDVRESIFYTKRQTPAESEQIFLQLDLRASAMLHGVDSQLFTDVSGQHIRYHLQGSDCPRRILLTIATSQSRLTSQNSEYAIYTAADAWNDAEIFMQSVTVPDVSIKRTKNALSSRHFHFWQAERHHVPEDTIRDSLKLKDSLPKPFRPTIEVQLHSFLTLALDGSER